MGGIHVRRGVFVLLSLWAAPASAESVAFEFTGEVVSINPSFASIVTVGSPAAGRFTYDTEAPDTNPDPTIGAYSDATLEFTVGLYSYAHSINASIQIYNDPTFDSFQVRGSTAGADPIGGLALAQVNLSIGGDPTLFASDALPSAPPALDLPGLDQSELVLGVVPPGSGVTYQYAMLLTLPEPGPTAAALTACTAVAGLGRARLRSGSRGSSAR